MSRAVAEAPKMPETIRLRGKHALPFHDTKPGGKVTATVDGTLSNVGFDEYDGKAVATVSLNRVRTARKVARRVARAARGR